MASNPVLVHACILTANHQCKPQIPTLVSFLRVGLTIRYPDPFHGRIKYTPIVCMEFSIQCIHPIMQHHTHDHAYLQAHVVLVENDSKDGTREVFRGWADEYTRTAQTPGTRSAKLASFNRGSSHKDLSTLGVARNLYLDALSEPEYAGVDYLIAVDTDMCFNWDVERQVGIIDALLPFSGTEWHVLYANGVCGWCAAISIVKALAWRR